ncbi:unnamed protein product [Darwinula stevensoni]|uniref:Uncharacterized protein n=1 Tax=Darwinula stevensoni TaxID=69355 RepID=A0A7R8X960_9CRUS|nr:unnamed protein product [Darwinula stevensoni]CAG0888668.1 unnamed protein product [Darwinula stevensoni]
MRGYPILIVVLLIVWTECSFGKKYALNSIPEPRSLADLEEKMSTIMDKITELATDNAQLKINKHLQLDNEKLKHEIAQQKLDIIQMKHDIAQLRHDNERLKRVNENLNAQRETAVEDRIQYLEAVTRQIVPPTCESLAKLGVTRSGAYLVDPDGVLRGDPPIRVFCDMDTDPPSTNVLHDSMETMEVGHCPDPGCYGRRIAYHASMKQMQALIDRSESCKQQIRYDCFSAALTTSGTNYAWWMDRRGDPQYYWEGSHAGEHTCNCGLTDNCEHSTQACNCDADAPKWESDSGTITNATALPITELRFGGLQSEGQKAKHTLGALVCTGRNPPSSPAGSCSSLRQAGHTGTGYHLISTKKGLLDVVLCRMDLEDTDEGFQLATGARIAEERVYFDAYRISNWSNAGIISFEGTELNMGNGMDVNTGIFTAPLDERRTFRSPVLIGLHQSSTEPQYDVLKERATAEEAKGAPESSAEPRHGHDTDRTDGRAAGPVSASLCTVRNGSL